MRWLLAVLAALVMFLAFVAGQASNGPLHGVYGLILALISAVLLVGAALVDTIVRMGRSEIRANDGDDDDQSLRHRRAGRL
jgi:hypothetical protein